MKLLNSLKELLETSETFTAPEKEQSGKGYNPRKRKRGRPGSNVKLGQGGTLDPLASGVLGEYLTQ
jgi:tRNA pseudouridine55 synthase